MTRLLVVAAVALVAVLAAGVVSGAGAEWDVYPGESIQDAIDGADPGDTIYVHAGEYCENVDVNKRLTMIGASADVVTVTATDARDHVFEVTADYVNISGFTVTGATGYTYAGIYLSRADHCKIYKNAASGNHWGTYLKDSSNNTLASNTASNNRGGIGLIEDCSNNTLTCNNASWNDNSGIWLYVSSDNRIHHNNLIDNANHNAYDSDGTNQWDSGSVGNYWSDYTGADNDTDGIGDTHHPIPGGGGSIDRFPLMHPWAGYMPQKGNLNHDNRITSADAAIALHLAATGAHDPVADVSGDDRVTSLDALMILQAAAGRIEL